MEIYKNKVSGKYFIYIQESGEEKALFITPKGKVKPLELKLFSYYQGGRDEDELLNKDKELITKKQVERFEQYSKDRSVEKRRKIFEIYKQLSPLEKQKLLKDLKKML